MRMETFPHQVLSSYWYSMGDNYLNALTDFGKYGYPGEVYQAKHVCATNYPLAVKKRTGLWIDGEFPAYTRTIYSSNPPYAASIK